MRPFGRTIGISIAAVVGAAAAVVVVLYATGNETYVRDWPLRLARMAKAEAMYQLGAEKNWRRIPDLERVSNPRPIPCPDPETTLVFVTGGQSNAANSNSALFGDPGDGRIYSWFDGTCYPARDPVPGASDVNGSLWPAFADRISKRLNRPVLLINGAISASQVRDWLDTRSGYYGALTGQIQAAQAAGFEPDLILWHQGETDAYFEWDTGRFRRQLSELMNDLLAAMPESRVYLFRASRCGSGWMPEGSERIRTAQTEVAEANPRIIAGMDTDTLGDSYRWDKCHFNEAGREAVLAEIVPEVARLFDGANAKP